MYDTKKMSVDEIREVLLEEFGIDTSEIKGKQNLAARLKEEEALNDTQAEVEFEDLENDLKQDGTQEETKEEDGKKNPVKGDPGWSDYILSLLTKDEMVKGNPTCDGLRRIASLLGMRFSIKSQMLNITDRSAAVKVTVMVYEDYGIDSVFEGLAEANPNNNTDVPYCNYMLATAETMAESRAFKRLFGLKKVITADEIVGNKTDIAAYNEDNGISTAQIKMMDNVAKRLDINAIAFIEKELGTPVVKITDLSKEAASKLCKTMSECQSGSSDAIPQELIGYSEDWKE